MFLCVLLVPVSALSAAAGELKMHILGLTFWGVIDVTLDGNELGMCFTDLLG